MSKRKKQGISPNAWLNNPLAPAPVCQSEHDMPIETPIDNPLQSGATPYPPEPRMVMPEELDRCPTEIFRRKRILNRSSSLQITELLHESVDGYRNRYIPNQSFGNNDPLKHLALVTITVPEGFQALVIRFKLFLPKITRGNYLRTSVVIENNINDIYPIYEGGTQIDWRVLHTLVNEKGKISLNAALNEDAEDVICSRIRAVGLLEVWAYSERRC